MKYYAPANNAVQAAHNEIAWAPGPQGLMKALRSRKGRQHVYRITIDLVQVGTLQSLDEIKAFKKVEKEKGTCVICGKHHKKNKPHKTHTVTAKNMEYIDSRPLPRRPPLGNWGG